MKTLVAASALLLPCTLAAQTADTVATVTFGGFVDAYYAYQLHRGSPGDIPFLTQPGRNNEFNINLAFIDARVSRDRIRGRIALQAGTSVALNYAAEPRAGLASGPDLQRHIQEAVIGYRLARDLWLDGGIYLSHIGSEGWISRDNWTYTRSLVAEYSPYYESGVKLTWSPGRFTASMNVVNGWQNVSENNSGKALGMRLDYTINNRVSVGYSDFIGNELADSLPSQTRWFHDFYGRAAFNRKLGFIGTFDVGKQAAAQWWGYSLVGRYQMTATVAFAARAEHYADRDQAIIRAPGGFVAGAYSFGVDVVPQGGLLWRTELRHFAGDSALFVANRTGGLSNHMAFIVTSLALTL